MYNQSSTLSRLFQGYETDTPVHDSVPVKGISSDSRQVKPGYVFVAIQGYASDGYTYIPQAVQNGAIAVVSEKPLTECPVKVIQVKNSRHALAWIARRFYDNPDESLIMMGVTGTNGKTTVTYLLETIFNYCHMPCGLMGTVQYRWSGNQINASHTTPDAVQLFQTLRAMVDSGIRAVAMEVSSHALELDRVTGIRYQAAIFTNLSRDHLDFHQNMDLYAKAKAKLFRQLHQKGVGVIHADDPYCQTMIDACEARCVQFGEKAIDSDYRIERSKITSQGTHFMLHNHSRSIEFFTPLLGDFNVLNASSAVITGIELGLDPEEIRKGLELMNRVPGRMEGFRSKNDFWVVVDYAHTPDALQNALLTAKAFTRNRLIVVFGCGGDRDRGKRAPMGKIAVDIGDDVIVTSDNPRTENPKSIIQDIVEGVTSSERYKVIEDRESAIREAIIMAKPGDTVLIAGKGHEDYQILGHDKIHFDDREVAQKYLDM